MQGRPAARRLPPVRPGREPTAQSGTTIALYLDGFEFHADEAAGNNRIADDMLKRQGLHHSRKWHVWSLTWDDLDHIQEPPKEHPAENADQQGHTNQIFKKLNPEHYAAARRWHESGNFDLLLDYLAQPNPAARSTWALACALGMADILQTTPDALQALVNSWAHADFSQKLAIQTPPTFIASVTGHESSR